MPPLQLSETDVGPVRDALRTIVSAETDVKTVRDSTDAKSAKSNVRMKYPRGPAECTLAERGTFLFFLQNFVLLKLCKKKGTVPIFVYSAPVTDPDAPATPAYKDRSTGLVVFGALTVCMGGLCGLFVPLLMFGHAAASRTAHVRVSWATHLFGILIYGLLAIALVWLGIGSMLARRWARALLLVLSWSWVPVGAFVLLGCVLLVPTLAKLSSASPPAFRIMTSTMFLVFGFAFVLIPVIWVSFYGSPHVKATCEARDPVRRWTDACPLPVLGLALWLAVSVLSMVWVPALGHGIAPFFGILLSGIPGKLYMWILGAIWSVAAVQVYQLKREGWWLALAAWTVHYTSSIITFARHDMVDVYRLMGTPQAQIDRLNVTGLLSGHWMSWSATLIAVLNLGYLAYVEKFFRGGAVGTVPQSGTVPPV